MASRKPGQKGKPAFLKRGRLVLTLIGSMGLHGALSALPWRMSPPALTPEPPPPPLYVVELLPWAEPTPLPSADETLYALQTFRHTAVERAERIEHTLSELASSLAAKSQTIAAQQKQVTTLTEAHSRLSGEIETLTAKKAELSAFLAEERERTRMLEAQLKEQLRKKEEELSAVKEAYEKLAAELRTEILHKDVTLRQVKEQLTITIVDRVLFPSGQATLTPEGLRVMEKVGAVLARIKDRRIQIEGHTDNVPIGPTLKETFPSNWELSTARATEVVKYLIAQAKIPPKQLIAVGRADTAPVAPNTTEEGRQQNRRIEITLLPPQEIGSGTAVNEDPRADRSHELS